MKTILGFLPVLFLCLSVVAQQSGIREVEKYRDLVNHVQDVSKTRFVKGYNLAGDGGHGFFTLTNTIASTNLGTRIQVTGHSYSWERQHDGMVDIRWFGAVDGFDSTTAIQAAIDYCSSNNFTVVIPAGVYLVSSPLNLKDNSKMVGLSTKSYLSAQSTVITLGMLSNTNILIRDIQLIGSSSIQVSIDGCKNVRCENVSITGANINFGGMTTGMHIEGGGNITLDRVYWYGNGLPTGTNQADYNLVVNFNGGTTTNLVILNPVVENLTSKCGLCMFGVNDPQVRGGTINMNNKGTASANNGYAILCYGFDGSPCFRPIFSGTWITNTYGTAVYLKNTIGGSVSEMSINNVAQLQSDNQLPSAGIVANIASGVRIVNNGITNSGINSGISLCLTTNCVVANNVVELPGTNHWAIELRGNNFGTSIKGNTLKAGHRGVGPLLTSSACIGCDIEGNQIINFVDGINLMSGSSNNIVRGNRMFNNVNAGIYDAGGYNTFDNNTIIGGNIGIWAAGSDGMIKANTIQGQLVGLNITGTGYRVDPMGRYNDNATPVNDAGGGVVKFLTSGTTPSVRDTLTYMFNYAAPATITDFTDGLPGAKRTFMTQNSNVTIQHGSSINLDGAHDFNMKNGDTLVLEKNTGGGWRQVGKSINGTYIQYDRALERFIINSPVYHFNNWHGEVPPSTTDYATEVLLSTNSTANALIVRFAAHGNLNGFTVRTSLGKTNYWFGFDGVEYQFPSTNGAPGQVLATDGATPQQLYWTNGTGSGSTYTFDPTQFSAAGGLVAITNGATTTNLVLKGAVTAPVLNVVGVNIDATTGTEFSKTLASNTSLGITGMVDGQAVSLTVTNTTFTLSFTNAITWISGVVPVIDTNAVNVFHFFQTGGRILGSDPERLANANIVALETLTGTGVVVKTNTTSFTTFDPLPIRYGGTGTNSFPGPATGGVVFYDLIGDRFQANGSEFEWNQSAKDLTINRQVPTGQPLLFLYEGSGTIPLMRLSSSLIEVSNDDFTFRTISSSNIVFQIGAIPSNGLRISPDLSTIVGPGITTPSRTNQMLYIPTFAGLPTGIPHPEAGTVALGYDVNNLHLYVYSAGWNQIDGGSGSGSTNGANWFANGTTNSQLNGTAFVNTITATNGFNTGSGSFVASALSLANSANIATVQNASSTAGSSLRLRGGTGVEGFLTFASGGNTDRGTFDTNGVFNAFYGTRSATSRVTNGITALNITATNIVATDGTQILTNISVGSGLTWTPGTLTLTTNGVTDNWLGSGTTNSQLNGNAALNAITVTNGITAKNITATNIVATDGTKILTNITIGSNLTWDPSTLTLSATGGGASDNWIASGTTNSFLNGNATVSKITSTNGFFTGPASFISGGLALSNAGGAGTVNNASGAAGSSLTLQGGAGLETYISFKAGGASGNTVRGTWDTNGILNAFFGSKTASEVVTNALSVGMGTSGSFARAGGVVFINKTVIGNVLTGEDDLMSFGVAGGTLAVDKDTIRFRCAGQWAGNANNKQIKVYFGSQQLFATGSQAFNNTDWVITVEIIRDNATGQIANVSWTSGDTLLPASAKIAFPTETLSGTVVFKITGEATNTNDIVQRSEVVEFLPTP